MRRLITISFLLFIALCGWANGAVSAKDSICVIEGTVKNLPDGCDVILYGSAGKYSGKQKTITQIKKGKFHFEKKVKSNEKYEVFLYPCIESLTLYVSPGTKTIITGNGTHPSTWNVKSDNLLQKEWNAYQKFEADSLSEYTTIRLKLNDIEAELYKNNTESEKMSLLKEREELLEKHNNLSKKYVEVLYNFMKDRAYSDVFANKLKSMADKAIELMEESIAEVKKEVLVSGPIDPSILKKVMEIYQDIEIKVVEKEEKTDEPIGIQNIAVGDIKRINLDELGEPIKLFPIDSDKLIRNNLNYRELRKQSMNCSKVSLNYSKGLRK